MKTVVILASLDTKADEAEFVAEQLRAMGAAPHLMDLSVVGDTRLSPDTTKAQVMEAGGSSIAEQLDHPSRQKASPVLIAGAIKLLAGMIENDEAHAVLALGGTQGTSNASAVLQALPYGFPKLILSTVASGDTSPFVGIKDITMMFSVSDILGLNPFSRKILANAAAAAYGMAQVERAVDAADGIKGTIGLTNLGVLTHGAMHAIDLFHQAGYEVITFHAIGAGGLAMEQMMREGIITAVFDYALGEVADQLFDGLRAADDTRLTTAGKLGLPQVICPGGSEHLGLLTEPNVVPKGWEDHQYTFHNPVVFAPRLNPEELDRVAKEIGKRLEHSKDRVHVLLPEKGTSRYCAPGNELANAEEDAMYLKSLETHLPAHIPRTVLPYNAEDPAFVEHAVDTLIAMIER